MGFSPVCETEFTLLNNKIEKTLSKTAKNVKKYICFNLEEAEQLLTQVYGTIKMDKYESSRFISLEEMIISLRYFAREGKVFCSVYRNRNNAKRRMDGRLNDSPDTAQGELKKAKEFAIDTPYLYDISRKW